METAVVAESVGCSVFIYDGIVAFLGCQLSKKKPCAFCALLK